MHTMSSAQVIAICGSIFFKNKWSRVWFHGLFVGAEMKRPRLQNGKLIKAERRSWSCIKVQTKGPKLRTLKNLDGTKDEEYVV